MKGLEKLSENLLLKVKLKEESTELQSALSSVDFEVIKEQIKTDNQKKTFWINIYNAYYQLLRKQGYNKPEIYKEKLFSIAGDKYSLDDVEHGILRKYRYKYSLGFLPNLITSKRIKSLAVEGIDYRIHFALNCGAQSCPPIAFYNSDRIDAQLDLATQSFLESESERDEEKKVLQTTALFKWFLGDFGGESGIREIYEEQLGWDVSGYAIKYRAYSWEDDLENFVE